MLKIIPINYLNKCLLLFALCSTALLLLLDQYFAITSLPLYIPLLWSLTIITISTWLSCLVLKSSLKATSPLSLSPLPNWLKCPAKPAKNSNAPKRQSIIEQLISEIDERYITTWYDSITTENTFKIEAKSLLTQLFKNIARKLTRVNEVRLTHKLANVLLLHLKEYRRSLRRLEKGGKTLEEVYRCSHPGSRSPVALEHTLHRMVALISREFLQWELVSSLPCKLLLSVLGKRLLKAIEELSEPLVLFRLILRYLTPSSAHVTQSPTIPKDPPQEILEPAVAHINLPPPTFKITEEPPQNYPERAELSLPITPQNLWPEEPPDDTISPIYEEPTDFATTIARLRTLLQQKSTATTPQPEEKSVICEGNAFSNLAIPWTEFCTAPDGSQQLLYCIQFEDIEQHGEDLFETTTATTRRQYSDFVHLHEALEVSEFSTIIAEVKLPEGGRIEMEGYLKTLCSRLGESSGQLRHFLRPSTAGKKADAVAPRLDRLLAKTVTGVFNTLRTVVPGFEMEEEEEALPTLMPLADVPWRFVENVERKGMGEDFRQLVAERIDYCTVDTAYEAVDTMEGSGDSELLQHWWNTVNCPDDEVEEMDSKLVMTCSVLDILCEILGGIESGSSMRQEAVVRWVKLLLGGGIEEGIREGLRGIFEGITEGFGEVGDPGGEEDVEERLVEGLAGRVHAELRGFFGEDEVRKMVEFFVRSLGAKRVNCDLGLQVMDVLASEVLSVCKERGGKRKGG